jgi:hypothetical protein
MHSSTHTRVVSLDVWFKSQSAAVLFSPHISNIFCADRIVVVVVEVVVVVVVLVVVVEVVVVLVDVVVFVHVLVEVVDDCVVVVVVEVMPQADMHIQNV